MKPIRIAFIADGMVSWGGGIDYLCQIITSFNSINKRGGLSLDLHVILPGKCNSDSVKRGDIILCENVSKINRDILIHTCDSNKSTNDILLYLNPDFCLPVLSKCFRWIKTPYVAYIPDFQAEYLGECFSVKEIYNRRKQYRHVVMHAPYVLATSHSVFEDIEKFYPDYRCHIFTQSFAPLSDPHFWDTSQANIKQYGIKDKYFIISNQFWKHKNHLTAFKAVREIVKRGKKDICLVCTGKMNDYRDSDYQRMLITFIDENKLQNHIRLLGFIPKVEQLELMKNAVALIQPTLFEGDPGGCSVYEAVCYGKKVIMSDINVNLEASNTEGVSYFPPYDYMTLADKMLHLLEDDNDTYSLSKVRKIYDQNSFKAEAFYKDMTLRIVGNI